MITDITQPKVKEFIGLKNAISRCFREEEFDTVIKKKLGLSTGKVKQTYKCKVVEEKASNEIDHNENPTSLDLQKSKYVSFNNNHQDEEELGEIKVKYCLSRNINAKRQKMIVF